MSKVKSVLNGIILVLQFLLLAILFFLCVLFLSHDFLTENGEEFNGFQFTEAIRRKLYWAMDLNGTETKIEEDSNVPLKYYRQYQEWEKTSGWKLPVLTTNYSDYCPNIPLINPLLNLYNNDQWQISPEIRIDQKLRFVIYLYSAFYDHRPEVPVVRVLGSYQWSKSYSIENDSNLHCLLWFDNTEYPVKGRVSGSDIWSWHKAEGEFYTVLLSCHIPEVYIKENIVPRTVSIQTSGNCTEMKPTNNLRIIVPGPRPREGLCDKVRNLFHIPRRLRVGMCVKAFRFGRKNVSGRLIEWLEMQRLIGVDKVHFYITSIGSDMQKVLDHYARQGFVDFRPLKFPGNQPNTPLVSDEYIDLLDAEVWGQEVLELNDCFYRHMTEYDYIAVMDIDELIVFPKGYSDSELDYLYKGLDILKFLMNPERILMKNDLKSLLYDMESKYPLEDVTYSLRHSLFHDKIETKRLNRNKTFIPEELYTMRHLHRTDFYPFGERMKSILNTKNVKTVHNHWPLLCLNSSVCPILDVDTRQAFLGHYRVNSSNDYDDHRTGLYMFDDSIHEYFEPLLVAYRTAVGQIFGL